MTGDDLAPMRGIAKGIGLGLIFWGVIIWLFRSVGY